MRTLTPIGWLAVAALIAVLAVAVLAGLGFRWDPLGLQQRRLETAQARAALAEDQAVARRLEAEGADAQLRRLDDYYQQQAAVQRMTATAVEQARTADDADHPLESRRADRLRGHDRELCGLAPDLAGCADAAAAAGGGDPAMPPGDPAA